MGEQPDTVSLADWHYTADEWRTFGNYEGRHMLKMVRQTRIWLYVLAGLTVIALLAVPVFAILNLVPWDKYLLGAAVLILIFGGFFIGICALVLSIQRSKLSTLTASSGRVTVYQNAICTSGIWHKWNFGDLLGNRFHDARTMTIGEGKPGELQLLEVRTVAYTSGNPTRDVVSSCRVPIPNGRRHEAEMIVERLEFEKRVAEAQK